MAIPHGKLAGLDRVYALVARLSTPVDYKAIDGGKVDLVFLLLSPPDAGAEHLKALAAVSRLVRHAATVEKLRGARSRDALAAVLHRAPTSAMPPEARRRRPGSTRICARSNRSTPRRRSTRLFDSTLALPEAGRSEIAFTVAPDAFHAAGAAHGTLYFKMLDDAAFYAANTLVSDRFLLTTAFNLHFTKAMKEGEARAEGRWISGRRRVFVAEARIVDSSGEECARGTGTFLRSHIALSGLDGLSRADRWMIASPPKLEASSLVRRAEVEGGFGMILARGDPDRGALVLLIAHRGAHVACLERELERERRLCLANGRPRAGASAEDVAQLVAKAPSIRSRFMVN